GAFRGRRVIVNPIGRVLSVASESGVDPKLSAALAACGIVQIDLVGRGRVGDWLVGSSGIGRRTIRRRFDVGDGGAARRDDDRANDLEPAWKAARHVSALS